MADEAKEIGRIGFDEHGKATVREPIIVSLARFKNSRYLDLRKYYEKEGGWAPTTKGITLQAAQIDDLLRILGENRDAIDSWFAK